MSKAFTAAAVCLVAMFISHVAPACGCIGEEAIAKPQPPVLTEAQLQINQALRQEVADVVKRSRNYKGDLEAVARELVNLQQRLELPGDLPEKDQAELVQSVQGALLRVGDALVIRYNRAHPKRSAARARAAAIPSPGELAAAEANGGGQGGNAVEDASAELIDIITRHVLPHQWAVNGGKAQISYFAPTMSLVVTAPSEVHGAVGNLLRQFRRQP